MPLLPMYSTFQVEGRHGASGRAEAAGDGGEVKFSKGRLMRLGCLMAITMVRRVIHFKKIHNSFNNLIAFVCS